MKDKAGYVKRLQSLSNELGVEAAKAVLGSVRAWRQQQESKGKEQGIAARPAAIMAMTIVLTELLLDEHFDPQCGEPRELAFRKATDAVHSGTILAMAALVNNGWSKQPIPNPSLAAVLLEDLQTDDE